MRNWRNSSLYREWREAVIERDGSCAICGSIDDLHAHHIRHASYWPNLRFDLTNGVALCRDCHTQFHTNFKRSFRVKCDDTDFYNFKKLVEYIKTKFKEER